MMRLIYAFILLFGIMFSACGGISPREQKMRVLNDSTISFKIENYQVTPKKAFELNSLEYFTKDTLHLVTCSEYVYFPFGKLTDRSCLTTSLLKDFVVTHFVRDTFTNTNINPPFFEWSEAMDLQLAGNKLILFLDNDPEASMHGYVRGGQTVDNDVVFSNGIKTKMSIEDFYAKFFDYFPQELINRYTVVELESCVTDVTHIYMFSHGKLTSVKFISQGQ